VHGTRGPGQPRSGSYAGGVSDDGAQAVGDVAAERAEEMAALRRAQADLADVDRALARLDDGTYGTCEACGVAIADEVLADAPATRACPEHAAAVAGRTADGPAGGAQI